MILTIVVNGISYNVSQSQFGCLIIKQAGTTFPVIVLDSDSVYAIQNYLNEILRNKPNVMFSDTDTRFKIGDTVYFKVLDYPEISNTAVYKGVISSVYCDRNSFEKEVRYLIASKGMNQLWLPKKDVFRTADEAFA